MTLIILAVVYVLYAIARLLKVLCKGEKIDALQALDLVCELCLSANLLLMGLELCDVIKIDGVILGIPAALYIIGKILIKKLSESKSK